MSSRSPLVKRATLVLLASTLAFDGVDLPDTYPKNPDIDALNYAFSLTLSDETDAIVGEATIDLRFRTAGIDRIRLDLIN